MYKRQMILSIPTLLLSACLLAPQNAQASIHTISGISITSGEMLSAQAEFSVAGDIATVVLSNISDRDVMIQSDILTAVFFDISDNRTLAAQTAVLTTGSVVHFGGTDPGGVVGGEWAYEAGLAGAPGGMKQGISSSGLGLFGQANFIGNNLEGPTAVNGVQYGITSQADNMTTGQSKVTGSVGLIQHSVTFTLSGASGLTGDDFSNVGFQYGTDTSADSFLFQVPEPGSMAIWTVIGLVAVGSRRRRA